MTEEFKGQPIGVNDKDGRPIFEGDRVHSTFRGKVGTVVLRPGRFVLRFDDEIEMTFLEENSYRLTIQEEGPARREGGDKMKTPTKTQIGMAIELMSMGHKKDPEALDYCVISGAVEETLLIEGTTPERVWTTDGGIHHRADVLAIPDERWCMEFLSENGGFRFHSRKDDGKRPWMGPWGITVYSKTGGQADPAIDYGYDPLDVFLHACARLSREISELTAKDKK